MLSLVRLLKQSQLSQNPNVQVLGGNWERWDFNSLVIWN